MSIELATPTFLKWSEVPITFSRKDQWTSFSDPRLYPLVLDPVVTSSRLTKVLIDGGSGLNVIFAKTLRKMCLDITDMLTQPDSPFYRIVPGNAAIPLGQVVLPVTFGTKEHYRTEYIRFEVANFETSYHAILGRLALAKFMAIPHYVYLVLKMP
ncbi:retropepsin-like domain-containing protein [Salmonella enterica]|nr:retropepsin-like domain-containing protein [Salmonella enterica]